jgi:hypothetical protein
MCRFKFLQTEFKFDYNGKLKKKASKEPGI